MNLCALVYRPNNANCHENDPFDYVLVDMLQFISIRHHQNAKDLNSDYFN